MLLWNTSLACSATYRENYGDKRTCISRMNVCIKTCLEADETLSVGPDRLLDPVAVTLLLPMLMEEATAVKGRVLVVRTIKGSMRFMVEGPWHQSTFLYQRYQSTGSWASRLYLWSCRSSQLVCNCLICIELYGGYQIPTMVILWCVAFWFLITYPKQDYVYACDFKEDNCTVLRKLLKNSKLCSLVFQNFYLIDPYLLVFIFTVVVHKFLKILVRQIIDVSPVRSVSTKLAIRNIIRYYCMWFVDNSWG